MRFNFKKISAVLTSAVMIGSSIGIAAAAAYPAPFVSGGTADVAIIYGTGAGVSALDAIAAGNLQTDLQAKIGTGTNVITTTCSGGDCFLWQVGINKLNVQEQLTSIKSTVVDKGDLPNVLANGVYVTGDGDEYGYTQDVQLSNLLYKPFSDSNYDDKKPHVGMIVENGNSIMNYTLTFSKKPTSNVNSAQHLEDFENTQINILGKKLTILTAVNTTGSPKLTLMGGAVVDSVNDMETKTVTLEGKTYAIRATYISETKAKICVSIDGGAEDCSLGPEGGLTEGSTVKLSNGVQLGIRSINYRGKSGTVDSIDFSLGANKIVLQDGAEVEVDDTGIDGFTSNITFSNSAGDLQLDKIVFEWIAKEKYFISENDSIKLPVFGGVKIASSGFYVPKKEVINVKAGNSQSMVLEIPLKDGTAKIPLLYGNETTWTAIGSDNDEILATSLTDTLVFNKSDKISPHLINNTFNESAAYFVASWNSSTDYESYLLTVTSITKDTSSKINTTIISRVGYTDSSLNTRVCEVESGKDCKIGNVVLRVEKAEPDEDSVQFTINSGGSFNRVYSKEGAMFYLPTQSWSERQTPLISVPGALNGSATNSTDWVLEMIEEDKDGNLGKGDNINFSLGWSGNRARVSSIKAQWASDGANTTDPDMETGENTDVYVDWVWSDLATKIEMDKPTGTDSQYSARVEYHGGESYGAVYVADVNADIGKVSETTTTVSQLGEVIYKDTEIDSANAKAKNLIVVGGSCINSVAANLLGSATPICGDAFKTTTGVGAGQFLIQSFGDKYAAGKVAVLVAGYNVDDTQNAATYLRNKAPDTAAGKKYIGTSATEATLQTTTA